VAEKYFYFIADGAVTTLPVTPQSYTWDVGKSMETVNVSALGDVYFPGKSTRHTGKIECMFPANEYSWIVPGAGTDPYSYVSLFANWASADQVVRYIVGGTDINAQVYIENIEYEEKDASGDVYATISLREYIDLEAATVTTLDTSSGTGGTQNSGQGKTSGSQTYTVQSGDTLSALCRRFYGNGAAKYYNALAAYNNIKNANLIYAGTTLTIPDVDTLLATDSSGVTTGNTIKKNSKTSKSSKTTTANLEVSQWSIWN
jgi:LysM repeat protein